MDIDLLSGGLAAGIGLAVATLIAATIRTVGRRTGEPADADRYALRAFGVVAVLAILLGIALAVDPEVARGGLTEIGIELIGAIPNLLVAVLVLSIGVLLAGAARGLARRILERLQPGLADTAGTLAYVVVLLLVLLTVAGQLGLRTDLVENVMLIVIGALALALALGLGLALRPALSAVVAARHVQRILARDDELTVDGWTGTVERLGPSSVRLVGDDGTFREVPNHWFLEHPATGHARLHQPGSEGEDRGAAPR